MPLGDDTAKWIAERPLARWTADTYGRLLRLHLAPTLGRFDLIDVTPDGVRSWRAGLLAVKRVLKALDG